MCVVLDINILSAVFSKQNALHADFEPVGKWIISGKGKIVFGGTKYRDELRKARWMLGLLVELGKMRKIVMLDDSMVDAAERAARLIEGAADFDDPHLVAIFRVSGCRLLCSHDIPAGKYVQQKRFYPATHTLPSIYKRRSHQTLLRDDMIASCCKPCAALLAAERKQIEAILDLKH